MWRTLLVETESGNIYVLREAGKVAEAQLWHFEARLARSHDEVGGITGVIVGEPTRGKPMLGFWVHAERGLQVRETTPVRVMWEEVVR